MTCSPQIQTPSPSMPSQKCPVAACPCSPDTASGNEAHEHKRLCHFSMGMHLHNKHPSSKLKTQRASLLPASLQGRHWEAVAALPPWGHKEQSQSCLSALPANCSERFQSSSFCFLPLPYFFYLICLFIYVFVFGMWTNDNWENQRTKGRPRTAGS